MKSCTVALTSILCAAALVACGRGSDRAPAVAPAGLNPGDGGYVSPPRVLSVGLAADGSLAITGAASPDGRIRGVVPSGRAFGATADKTGKFTLLMPRPPGPVLLNLSQERGGQGTRAEGWLFVPPDGPAHAVILRPGAAALPLNRQAGLVATADYDAAGGAAVGGMASPGQTVEVSFDNGPAVEARADERGAFGARISSEGRIAPGEHTVHISAGRQSSERRVTLVAPAQQMAGALREPDGWRVVWPLPGGGLQSTFVVTGQERS